MRYRFVMSRLLWCRVFQQEKAIEVCIAEIYDECKGCGQRRDDVEKHKCRTRRVVDSPHPPGNGYAGKVLSVGHDKAVTSGEALTRAYKRLKAKRRR